MKKQTLLLSFLLLTSLANAQQQAFTYIKDINIIHLTGDSSHIVFNRYVKTQDKIQERRVTIDGQNYRMSLKKVRSIGKVQTIMDANGTKLAEVFLGSVKKNNILLANGTELVFESAGGWEWSYKMNGKEVVKASVVKNGSVKKILIENMDPKLVSPAVLLSSMERGTEIMKSSSATPVIFISVLLTVMRTVLAEN